MQPASRLLQGKLFRFHLVQWIIASHGRTDIRRWFWFGSWFRRRQLLLSFSLCQLRGLRSGGLDALLELGTLSTQLVQRLFTLLFTALALGFTLLFVSFATLNGIQLSGQQFY